MKRKNTQPDTTEQNTTPPPGPPQHGQDNADILRVIQINKDFAKWLKREVSKIQKEIMEEDLIDYMNYIKILIKPEESRTNANKKFVQSCESRPEFIKKINNVKEELEYVVSVIQNHELYDEALKFSRPITEILSTLNLILNKLTIHQEHLLMHRLKKKYHITKSVREIAKKFSGGSSTTNKKSPPRLKMKKGRKGASSQSSNQNPGNSRSETDSSCSTSHNLNGLSVVRIENKRPSTKTHSHHKTANNIKSGKQPKTKQAKPRF